MKPQKTARRNEVRLSEFTSREMTRRGVSTETVIRDVIKGRYVGLSVRRPTPHVTFVNASHVTGRPESSKPGRCEVPLKEWLANRAEALAITPYGVYNRMWRGVDPWPKLRRVNKRVILVREMIVKNFRTRI